MHALRLFALAFLLVGSALFLSSTTELLQAKMEDDAVLLVNIYAPTKDNPNYHVEKIPVHGVAYVPANSRAMEKISLAVLFIVIGYACHALTTRAPIRIQVLKRLFAFQKVKQKRKRRR